MRPLLAVPLLLLLATNAHAADVCPVLRNQTAAPDVATRIAAAACNEHMLWYRPFIDRNGRMASATVSEGEASRLGDGQTPAWRRVASYWKEAGLLPSIAHRAGATDCEYAASPSYPGTACRGFVIDNPWSATFISWVMVKAGLPGFRPDASHLAYVRAAYLHPQTSAYAYRDPARTPPSVGDLLCYVRHSNHAFGHEGLQALLEKPGGLFMHCDIVVATNPNNDATAYLIGGNVQQGVTMRMLPLNRNGEFWGLPKRTGDDTPCSPDSESGCNFNRQDWAVLLKLKPAEQLATLPRAAAVAAGPLLPTAAPALQCCVNCVVGSDIPRCAQESVP
ncbi:MAG: DUF2272 domain-containing protein [Pseudoxanthomonas sp.]